MRTLIDELLEMETAPTVHSCGCKHSANKGQHHGAFQLWASQNGEVGNPGQERAAVQAAIAAGNRNENRLSDLIFFRRHPERNGRLIQRSEPNFRALSQEWLRIRDQLVRPELRGGYRPNYTPPDPQTSCAVPQRSVSSEMEMFETLDFETPTPTRPNARLCLYQNASISSHRNHFSCQATRWARAIRAIAATTASPCQPRVGDSAYDTGAGIISAIQSANTCLGLPIETVHIFGHSGSYGFFGTDPFGAVGLYNTPVDPTSRGNGGRTVGDIPTLALSNNVVFYLHGCNTAEGTKNFAKSLYDHLAASLTNPVVFGHYNGGCAGRDNSWKRYSNSSPNGTLIRGGILGRFGVRNCCS